MGIYICPFLCTQAQSRRSFINTRKLQGQLVLFKHGHPSHVRFCQCPHNHFVKTQRNLAENGISRGKAL